jgi:hypothetical protein
LTPVPSPSVVYPQVLLGIQSVLWGLVATGGRIALALNGSGILYGHGAPPHGAGAFAVDVAVLALVSGMAAVSVLVLVGLQRRRAGAWAAAIVLECFMICFGLYLAYGSIGGFLAGGGGALLSCAAVVCLVGRPARRFTRCQH